LFRQASLEESNRLRLGTALKYINRVRKAKAGKGWAKVRKGILSLEEIS
jgi:hypothetical protein